MGVPELEAVELDKDRYSSGEVKVAGIVGGKMQQQVRSHRKSLKPCNLKTTKQQHNVDVQQQWRSSIMGRTEL
jgi:hypothetical protein